MKIQQRNTAIQSFYSIKNLPEKRRIVYEAIEHLGEACNLDIAYYLKIPINRVTPRTNELVKIGLVVEAKRDISQRTGKRVIFWKISEPQNQQSLF